MRSGKIDKERKRVYLAELDAAIELGAAGVEFTRQFISKFILK